MQRLITTEKIPLMLWLDQLEDEALAQARNLANLPWAFHHVALMADAHVGYGMPIGGVLATTDVIIPKRNEGDLEDMPAEVLAHLKIHPVATLEEALAVSLEPSVHWDELAIS